MTPFLFVKSGQTLNAYVNGALSNGTTTNSVPVSINPMGNLRFGYYNTYLNGQMDEARIYTKALTQEEITALYNNPAITNNTGLTGYWKFDEAPFSEQRKYGGHEYDGETGLSYMNARYYNGKIGRFVSQDPAFLVVGDNGQLKSKTGLDLQTYLSDPQNFNSYSYARNNPLVYIDETGEFVFPIMQEKTGFMAFPTMGEMKAELRNGWNGYMAFRESVGQWAENNPMLYNILTFAASMKGGKAPMLKSGKMNENLLPAPVHGKLGNIIPRMNKVSLPQYTQETLSQYETNGFSERLSGYKGGEIFKNKPGYLPAQNDPQYYREWDVKPLQQGVGRGAERFISGKNGEVYWTNTHYGDNPGTPFFKIK